MRKFLNQYETDIVIGFACLCAVVLEATVVIALKF
jgi:hypothetical protein